MSRDAWRPAVLVASILLVVASACGGPSLPTDLTEQRTIAVLRAIESPDAPNPEPHFRAELQAAGYVEGYNLRILPPDGRSYPDPGDAAAAVAAWRADGVELVVALSSTGAAAAREAAPDLPVLFVSTDPASTGLVGDEQEPEGLLTGVSFRVPPDRTIMLARRVLPGLETLGLAYPPEDPAALAHRDGVAAAAEALGVTLLTEEFADAGDVGAAIDRLVERGIDALLLSTSPTATSALDATAEAVARHALPVVANTHLAEFALVSLYPDSSEIQRQLGRQAARILSGSSPSAIPVEDPRRFLTRLDATVAADLGIDLSEEVVREANEVVTR